MKRADYLEPEKLEPVPETSLLERLEPDLFPRPTSIDNGADDVETDYATDISSPLNPAIFYTSVNDHIRETNIHPTPSIDSVPQVPFMQFPMRTANETEADYIETIITQAVRYGNITDRRIRSILHRAIADMHDGIGVTAGVTESRRRASISNSDVF